MGIAIPIKQYAWTPPLGARFQYFDDKEDVVTMYVITTVDGKDEHAFEDELTLQKI